MGRKKHSNALLDACWTGDLHTVAGLLVDGVELECRNEYQETPIIRAAAAGHADIVELLWKHGASPNAQSETGQTGLTWAVRLGHTDVVKELLKCKRTDVDLANHDGFTPLLLATLRGDAETARLLVRKGANPQKATPNRISPELCAKREGHAGITALFETGALPAHDDDASEDATDPSWRKTGDHEVTHSCETGGRELTEVFNFETRERITFSRNIKTGAESLFRENFGRIGNTAVIEQAAQKLEEHGGTRPDTRRVDKPKQSIRIA